MKTISYSIKCKICGDTMKDDNDGIETVNHIAIRHADDLMQVLQEKFFEVSLQP